MKPCQKIHRQLAAYLSGELEKDVRAGIEAHLEVCSRCRKEAAALGEVMETVDMLAPDLENVMATVDWEGLPERIADRVFKDTVHGPERKKHAGGGAFFFRHHWKPVLAALLTGVLLGALTTTWLVRSPRRVASPETVFNVTPDFLEQVDLELARRETLDYLEKSQVLLLDFVQADPARAAQTWPGDVAVRQARDLLYKKKYINRQLDNFRMAKAKQICDQIEFLIVELTQVSDGLSEAEISTIQDYIGKRQLLLKINLLQHELAKDEV